MGKILTARRNSGGVIFEVEVGYNEATLLKGHYDNIHMFAENVAGFETNISTRGRNSSTKYFLVPRHLRKGLDYKCPVNCQKIDIGSKVIFVYVVDKIPQMPFLREQGYGEIPSP